MNTLKTLALAICFLPLTILIATNSTDLDILFQRTQVSEGKAQVEAFIVYSKALEATNKTKAIAEAGRALRISRSLKGDPGSEVAALINYFELCIAGNAIQQAEEQIPQIEILKPRIPDSSVLKLNILEGRTQLLSGNYTLAEPVLIEALSRVKEPYQKAKIQGYLSECFRYQGDYPKAMEIGIDAFQYFERIKDSAQISASLMQIGIIEHIMGEYETSKEKFLKVASWYTRNRDSTGLGFAESVLGLTYYRQDSLEKAIKHAYHSFEIRKALNDPRGKGESLNNLALIYMRKGNWEQARSYMESSLRNLEAGNDYRQIPVILTNLGACYSQLGDVSKAKQLFETSIKRAQVDGADHSRSKAYQEMYRLLSAEKDFENAFYYSIRYQELEDSLTNEAKDRSIKELTKMYESTKTQVENERLKRELAEVQSRKRLRFGLIAIGFLLAALAALAWNRQRQRVRQTKRLFEQERQIRETEQRLAQAELDRTREALQAKEESMKNYMQGVLEKNTLIENLEAQIKAIEVKDNDAETERAKRLAELRQMKILTEEDWRAFRHHFDQVYRGFLDRLMKQYPDLTKGERRLFVLVKLNLSTTEMADILGISADSVKKARYRLRKKLQLSEDQPLTPFIQAFR